MKPSNENETPIIDYFNKQGHSDNQQLPLIIRPQDAQMDLSKWVVVNHEKFTADLVKYGAILFRNFSIKTPGDFKLFLDNFNSEPLPYMFRSSPREQLNQSIKNIYLSTTYPNNRKIYLHNESSYSRVWGGKIVFCCLKPADIGGETPLADSRKVLKSISSDLIDKFKKKGVRYRRSLLPDMGMPWQEVFQTDDLNVVRETCLKYNIDYKFTSNRGMQIEWSKPAIYIHPKSNEETWFNHVYFFHKYSRYEECGIPFGHPFPAEYITSEVFFGDGSEINEDEYLEIKKAYAENVTTFPYQQGDIIFVDNMLVAHGRNPYKGDRVIATAIIDPVHDSGY